MVTAIALPEYSYRQAQSENSLYTQSCHQGENGELYMEKSFNWNNYDSTSEIKMLTYSRTLAARTLMACLPVLFLTHS